MAANRPQRSSRTANPKYPDINLDDLETWGFVNPPASSSPAPFSHPSSDGGPPDLKPRKKRRAPRPPVSFSVLFSSLPAPTADFLDHLTPHLSDLLDTRDTLRVQIARTDDQGRLMSPLTRLEVAELGAGLLEAQAAGPPSELHARLARKLDVQARKRLLSLPLPSLTPYLSLPRTTRVLPMAPPPLHPPPPGVLDALPTRTPYECSFARRLYGASAWRAGHDERLLWRDWEAHARAGWCALMEDVGRHHALMHPDRDSPPFSPAPIDYRPLLPSDLPQVHDLLARTFWLGINVSSSLDYAAEQCTIVALFKRLVVGVALLSSPEEGYVQYIAVRAGWEGAGIAKFMLYHLITSNPQVDITLHVSADSPAMLLYNKFGFKPEAFEVGFYEHYVDTRNRCGNAFKVRLRRG